jgi:hypothetical protein
MKPICLKGFVMGLGRRKGHSCPFMVSHAWRRGSALSVVLNALSIRIVSRGYKCFDSQGARIWPGIKAAL